MAKQSSHVNATDTNQDHIGVLIAAGAVVLLICCVLEWIRYRAEPTMRTQFGETRTYKLPDGSDILLNANTTLSISDDWGQTTDREVWMKGEAWFSVRPVPGSRFIVHTAHYNLTASGSQFNVLDRNATFQVLLQQGDLAIRANNISTGNETYLEPGELVFLSKQQLVKGPANHSQVLAWKDKKIVFSNAGLPEVAAFIESYYGIAVRTDAAVTPATTVSGTMPNHNARALLQALTAATGLNFALKNNRVTVQAKD